MLCPSPACLQRGLLMGSDYLSPLINLVSCLVLNSCELLVLG